MDASRPRANAKPATMTPACWGLLTRAMPRELNAMLTQAERTMLISCLPLLRAAVKPASAVETAVVLKRLSLHYPPPSAPHTPHEANARWDDWYGDLEGVPLDIISQAADAWRRSSERWFPTPGQFLAAVALATQTRADALQRLEMLASMDPPSPTPALIGVDIGRGDEESFVVVNLGELVGGIGKAGR